MTLAHLEEVVLRVSESSWLEFSDDVMVSESLGESIIMVTSSHLEMASSRLAGCVCLPSSLCEGDSWSSSRWSDIVCLSVCDDGRSPCASLSTWDGEEWMSGSQLASRMADSSSSPSAGLAVASRLT